MILRFNESEKFVISLSKCEVFRLKYCPSNFARNVSVLSKFSREKIKHSSLALPLESFEFQNVRQNGSSSLFIYSPYSF